MSDTLTNVHRRKRSPVVTATLSVAVTIMAQDTKRPVLLSHDRIDGPLAGTYRVEDLQVFADGRVVYAEESVKTAASRQREKAVYRLRIGSDKTRHLAELLDSDEVRSLPKILPAQIAPIDFFWSKSLAIARNKNEIQEIKIENFYPFINMDRSLYPKALIELECNLLDIQAAATKRPEDEGTWCKALIRSASETGGPAVTTLYSQDSTQPKVVAGEGWGSVRLGASSTVVDAFLGKGQRGNGYRDVYFKQYAPKGVEVSFENSTDTVHAIFFYNGQRNDEQIGVFCGQTAKGIGWQSTVEDVKNAYGKPTAEFSGSDWGGKWQRLVFAGIDFRFENGKMVRIGIPGK